MGTRRTLRLLATVAVAGGMLGAAQLPVLAAPATTLSVNISVSSTFMLNQFTFVVFGSRWASGTASGLVTGATSGEVLKLFAQQFPYKKPAAPLGTPVTISQSRLRYSFRVTPTLATRYQAEVFATSTATIPLASSHVQIIYVVSYTTITQSHRCPRPNCTNTVHLHIHVPASALRTEMAKKWLTYFAVNLSRTQIPPPPGLLKLGAGHPRVTRSRRVSAHQYTLTVTFTFRIGPDAAAWRWNFCAKDTEAKDGLGLPKYEHCGDKVIPAGLYYLG